MATIDFPVGLPLPLRSGYDINHASPLMRTELQSGRARQRRRYTSVPSIASVSWIMDALQAQVFESWFRDALSDGVEWFNVTLRTPLGLQAHQCRFVEMYAGPQLVSVNLWRFAANLELRQRPIPPAGLGYVPSFVQRSDLFDRAINQEWPV